MGDRPQIGFGVGRAVVKTYRLPVAPDRDEFSAATRRTLAARAGHRCSNPECGALTSGPGQDPDTVVDVGVAAHVTAAAKGGPRYDPALSRPERRAASNGIWACQRCGKLIDSDDSKHTVALLRRWKSEAEERAAQMVAAGVGSVEPALELAAPWLDADDSILSFASSAVEAVGRRAELAELDTFLADSRSFSWWVWTGPAGVGKSRLAVELCRAASADWHAGFLREAHQHRLGALRPLSPTLVVVDYAAQRAGWLSDALLQLAARDGGPPIRVLVLERDASGPWWDRLQRLHRIGESSPIASSRFSFPRELSGLNPDDLRALIVSVATHLNAPTSRTDTDDIADHAVHLDALGSPLSAYLATLDWLDTAGLSEGRDAALRRLIQRADDRLVAGLIEPTISQARRARLFSTALGGSAGRDDHEAAATEAPPGLLPTPWQLPTETAEIALGGLRPDLLGELFVLDELGELSLRAEAARAVLALAARRRLDAFTAFVGRAARDHPDHPKLSGLMDVLVDEPAWPRLAVDVLPLLRRSDHPLVATILGRLSSLQERTGDPESRQLVAEAQFRMANLLANEEQAERANALYTAALGSADSDWPIYASLLNNRGISWLQLGREDLALGDFTAVVGSVTAADEIRACALNNRADQFRDSGDLPAAIADRTSLLELTNTSFDRRYIALSRRAREKWALGDHQGTYADFDAILATGDIAVEQKMETRLVRAELLLDQGRFQEARDDLHHVMQSPRNFPNVEAQAQQLVAQYSQLQGDNDRFGTC